MKKITLIFMLALTFINCSKDNDDSSISDKVLSGTVEGEDFTFVSGKAFYQDSEDKDDVSLYLTNIDVDCDTSVLDIDLYIYAVVPTAVGVYSDINIVTNNADGIPFNNLNQTVEITNVSDTSISGKMSLNHESSSISEESIFEGIFKIIICE